MEQEQRQQESNDDEENDPLKALRDRLSKIREQLQRDSQEDNGPSPMEVRIAPPPPPPEEDDDGPMVPGFIRVLHLMTMRHKIVNQDK